MRERPSAREVLIGDDALEPSSFVERVRRCLLELGFVETALPGPYLRPLCHLAKNGTGAWVEAGLSIRAARQLAELLASERAPVWLLEAVARDDGSDRAGVHQEVEVSAERVSQGVASSPHELPPLPGELAVREAPSGADRNIAAAGFAHAALRWVWPHVRATPTHSRITLGRWIPPRAGFRRVEGVTDPAEARFRNAIVDATEKAIVDGPGGRPMLRLVFADGSRQMRMLGPRELAWARRLLG